MKEIEGFKDYLKTVNVLKHMQHGFSLANAVKQATGKDISQREEDTMQTKY